MRQTARAVFRRDRTIRLPFGRAKTSPIDAQDVARVAVAVLTNPAPHVGKVYEMTGQRSQDMQAMAAEYSAALGRPLTYIDVPFAEWEAELRCHDLPDPVRQHVRIMAQLHAANRYDRMTHEVERLTGKPAASVHDFVLRHAQTIAPTH